MWHEDVTPTCSLTSTSLTLPSLVPLFPGCPAVNADRLCWPRCHSLLCQERVSSAINHNTANDSRFHSIRSKLDCEGDSRWADRLVAYPKDNDDFRCRFFSDSVEVARTENRVMAETDGTSKKALTHRLAVPIWNIPDLEYRRLSREPPKFETSLLGRLNP